MDAQIRFLEEISSNGHVALNVMQYDGWLLRFSGGHTSRANSVSVLYPSEKDLAEKVAHCEEYYAKQGKTAYFLPLACDSSVYYPIENQQKNIDILFVATLYTSKKRMHLIQAVVNNFPKAKILVYGWYKPFVKTPLKCLFREKRNIYQNTNIPPSKVNELFSHCKIALNIHHEQTFHGANQRLLHFAVTAFL